ncbi:MAG: PilZ domain-containing protein [Verrucomicrobiota bacterium]
MEGLNERLVEKIEQLNDKEKIELLLQLESGNFDPNRREHPRVPFFAEVSYVNADDQTTQEFVRDLSVGGMFIETSAPLEAGQDIQARFSLPGLKEDIRIPAKVVRLTPEGMGVRFQRPLSHRLRHFLPRLAFWRRRAALIAYLKVTLKENLSPTFLQKSKDQQQRLQYALQSINRVLYHGKNYYCPVCNSAVRKFQPRYNSDVRRPAARCPVCQSLERHRLDFLFLRDKTDLASPRPKRLLHVAPEAMFEQLFARIESVTAISIDLKERKADAVADITELPFINASFDAIYCSHVLEHIPDDKRALAELYRVLKPNGWGLIEVPITARQTFEDPDVEDPVMRTKLFGQHDHCRRYGVDFKERLNGAGFSTSLYTADDIINDHEELQRNGIDENRKLFYSRKE